MTQTESKTVRDAILDYIGPGSATKTTLVELYGDEYGDKEVKLELLNLLEEGVLEEHPGIDGAYRKQ